MRERDVQAVVVGIARAFVLRDVAVIRIGTPDVEVPLQQDVDAAEVLPLFFGGNLETKRREGRSIPRSCKVPQTLFYSDHVRYVEQLERYRAVFPAEQMLILVYDDFASDNRAVLGRVLRFLEVDDTVAIQPVRTKTGKAVRSLFLKHLADSARVARVNPARATRLGRAVDALTPGPLRSEQFRARWRRLVYKDPGPPDERFMLELRRRFKPEVVALSEYLGRDLVDEWGYRRLG